MTKLDGLYSNNVKTIAANNKYVFVGTSNGLVISDDGGQKFFPAEIFIKGATTFNSGEEILSVVLEDLLIAVMTDQAVYISNDDGESFAKRTFQDGITGGHMTDMAFHDGVLYIGTDLGLSVTYDHGNTFQKLNTDAWITELKVDNFGIYIAAYGGFASHVDGGLYVSRDHGKSFWYSDYYNGGCFTTSSAKSVIALEEGKKVFVTDHFSVAEYFGDKENSCRSVFSPNNGMYSTGLKANTIKGYLIIGAEEKGVFSLNLDNLNESNAIVSADGSLIKYMQTSKVYGDTL